MFPDGTAPALGKWRMITHCVASGGSGSVPGIDTTGRYIQVDNLSSTGAQGKNTAPNMASGTALRVAMCAGVASSAYDYNSDMDNSLIDEVRVWFSTGVASVAPLTVAQINTGFASNTWSSALNGGTYAPAPLVYYPFRQWGDESSSSTYVFKAYNEMAPTGDTNHASHMERVGGTDHSRVIYKDNSDFAAPVNCLPSWWVLGNSTWGGSIWRNGAAGITPQYTIPNPSGTNTIMWPDYKATYGPISPQYAAPGDTNGIRLSIKWACDTGGTANPSTTTHWPQNIGFGWPRAETLTLDFPLDTPGCLGTNRCGGLTHTVTQYAPTASGDYANQDNTNVPARTAVTYTMQMPVRSLLVVCRVDGLQADASAATTTNLVQVPVADPFICSTLTYSSVTVSARAHSCALMTTTGLPLQVAGTVASSYPITCGAGVGNTGGGGAVGIRSAGNYPVVTATPWCAIGEMSFTIQGLTYSVTTVKASVNMVSAIGVRAVSYASGLYALGEPLIWQPAFSTAGSARASAAFVYWKQGALDHQLTCDATSCASCACVSYTYKMNAAATSASFGADSNPLRSTVSDWQVGPAATLDTLVLTYSTPDGPYTITIKRSPPQVAASNIAFTAPTTCPDTATYSKTNSFPTVTGTLPITPVAPTLAIGALTTAALSVTHILNYTVNVPLCYSTVTFAAAGTWTGWNDQGVAAYDRTWQWTGGVGLTLGTLSPPATSSPIVVGVDGTVTMLLIDDNDGTYSFKLTRPAYFSVSTWGWDWDAAYGSSPYSLGNPSPNFAQGTYPSGNGHVFSTPLWFTTTNLLFTAVIDTGSAADYAWSTAPGTKVGITAGVNSVSLNSKTGTQNLYLISSMDGPYHFQFVRYTSAVSSITLHGLRYDFGVVGAPQEESISWTYAAANVAPVNAATIDLPFRWEAVRIKVNFACSSTLPAIPCAALTFNWNAGGAAAPGAAGTWTSPDSPSLTVGTPTSFTFISNNDGKWTWTFNRLAQRITNAAIQSRLTDNTLSAANTIAAATYSPAFTQLALTANTPCNFTITVRRRTGTRALRAVTFAVLRAVLIVVVAVVLCCLLSGSLHQRCDSDGLHVWHRASPDVWSVHRSRDLHRDEHQLHDGRDRLLAAQPACAGRGQRHAVHPRG